MSNIHVYESKRNYWLLSGALLTFFLTWSFCFSLFAIWLNQAVGLNGESTGLIYSINAIAALFVQPIYGFIQDKLGLRKNLLIFVGVLLIGSGPFFIFAYAPLLKINLILGSAIGGIYFGVVFMGGVGALETYVERVSRATGFEFGKARMWGSIGWAVATFFTGKLFNINPNINFIAASCCAILFLVSILLVRPAASKEEELKVDSEASKIKLTDTISLFGTKKFLALITFVMGVTCIYTVYDQQFPVYFASLFPTKEAGNEMYGYLNSFQVLLEAGGMFLAPFIVNKIGAKNGLILSGIIMAVRIVGSGYANGALEISFIKLLHAAELPIMLVALFKYISATFDARFSSTIYLVGFIFSTQVMASVLSAVAGRMYDTIGFAASYKILGLIVSIFVVISALILTDDRKKTSPEATTESYETR